MISCISWIYGFNRRNWLFVKIFLPNHTHFLTVQTTDATLISSKRYFNVVSWEKNEWPFSTLWFRNHSWNFCPMEFWTTFISRSQKKLGVRMIPKSYVGKQEQWCKSFFGIGQGQWYKFLLPSGNVVPMDRKTHGKTDQCR